VSSSGVLGGVRHDRRHAVEVHHEEREVVRTFSIASGRGIAVALGDATPADDRYAAIAAN
jgi:hypothetical protein